MANVGCRYSHRHEQEKGKAKKKSDDKHNSEEKGEKLDYLHSSILHISRPEINVTFSPTTRSQRLPRTSH